MGFSRIILAFSLTNGIQHHEKWDGSGYPRGLEGNEIDRNACIFAVADAFDAMTSDRVYRAGLTYEAAAAELNQGAGTHFDPKVVEVFCSIPPQEWEVTTKSVGKSPGHNAKG